MGERGVPVDDHESHAVLKADTADDQLRYLRELKPVRRFHL
jgi:hypothetical protein